MERKKENRKNRKTKTTFKTNEGRVKRKKESSLRCKSGFCSRVHNARKHGMKLLQFSKCVDNRSVFCKRWSVAKTNVQ